MLIWQAYFLSDPDSPRHSTGISLVFYWLFCNNRKYLVLNGSIRPARGCQQIQPLKPDPGWGFTILYSLELLHFLCWPPWDETGEELLKVISVCRGTVEVRIGVGEKGCWGEDQRVEMISQFWNLCRACPAMDVDKVKFVRTLILVKLSWIGIRIPHQALPSLYLYAALEIL